MKILMIAPTPFFADRGCHIRIYEEVMGLQKLGHEVIVCTYGLGRDVDGVNTVRTINFPWYKKLSAGPSKTKILLLPFLCATSIREIKRFNPDIIHVHLHEGACIARICKIFYPRKAYVFDMQGGLVKEVLQHGFIKENGLGYKFLSFLEKRIVGWMPIITSSSHMIEDVIKLGCKKENCTNVKDGVDTEMFSSAEADENIKREYGIDNITNNVLYMGLLEEYQGIDLLIDSFALVLKQIPNGKLILIGYPNIELYKQKCREKGIEKSVLFTGAINHMQIPAYLALASIAVAPKLSQTEGNIKVYYYMSMGMATITFDNEINREILSDTGIFVQEKNAEALSKKIIWALSHCEECEEIGRRARQRAVNNLSNMNVAKRIEDVYKKLLK